MLTLALAACGGDDDGTAEPTGGSTSAGATTEAAEDAPTDVADESDAGDVAEDDDRTVPEVPLVTADVAEVVATGLAAPWGLAELPDGAWLVTERDDRRLLRVDDGSTTPITGDGADDLAELTVTDGEGGLLGVAVSPTFDEDGLVFLYRTAEGGNQVVRGELRGTRLGALEVILDAVPASTTHDGGRLAFGPDGHLYVTTGDAGSPRLAQNPDSLAGKILRITPDGSAAPDNPIPGSPLWSLGHRDVQGLGWSEDGRMFASELGQNAADELNLVVAGGNYGWPDVEGVGAEASTAAGFVDPLVTWDTAEASPSGLAVTDEGVYLAALQGERLWRVPLAAEGVGQPQSLLEGDTGRVRTVVTGSDGDLYVLTSTTDGRGEPGPDDDRLLRVAVDD